MKNTTPVSIGRMIRSMAKIEQPAALVVSSRKSAAQVAQELGFFDQPHLAKALQRFIGRTATQLQKPDAADPLSLLYKTRDLPSS